MKIVDSDCRLKAPGPMSELEHLAKVRREIEIQNKLGRAVYPRWPG